jgi:hypothetical protein
MTFGKASFASGKDLPIMSCPICYPPRPMVIKTIKSSLRGKAQTVVLECAACGATVNAAPDIGDDADPSFKQARARRPPEQ